MRLQPALVLLAAVLVAVVLYGVALPVATIPHDASPTRGSSGTLAEGIRLHTLRALVTVWLFFLGACFGSFLNVVIYRVPRGITLLGSSFCPFCCHPIRMRHNIPVVGWLLLRGRCYDCRLPISPRYPIVETLVGTIFLSLAVIELFTGGRNLPVRVPNHYVGIEWILFSPQWDLIHIYGWHCGVLTILLSWALIWFDGQRVPIRYALLVFTAIFVLSAAAPYLHCVGWMSVQSHWPLQQSEALTAALVGAIGGAFCGILASSTHRILDGSQRPASEQARQVGVSKGGLSMALAGAALGWQSALSITLLTPMVRLLWSLGFGRWTPRLSGSWPLAVVLATWLHIACWRWLSLIPVWPSHVSDPLLAPVQIVVAIYLSGQVSRWHRRSTDTRTPVGAASITS